MKRIKPWKAWKRFPICVSVRCYKTDKWGNSIDAPWNEIELEERAWTDIMVKVKGSNASVTCTLEGIKTEEEIDKALEKAAESEFEDYLTEELTRLIQKALLSK
ncbi:hypothetical protein MYX07_06200 [Patescibacteria group bacterium AH-259-L07]|nr:hypothetical protein [Patescibacteria group bacterium AH-259-L07]